MSSPIPPALRPVSDELSADQRIAVTIPTAAKLVDCSESTIRRAVKDGRLHPSTALGRPLLSIDELRSFLFGT